MIFKFPLLFVASLAVPFVIAVLLGVAAHSLSYQFDAVAFYRWGSGVAAGLLIGWTLWRAA